MNRSSHASTVRTAESRQAATSPGEPRLALPAAPEPAATYGEAVLGNKSSTEELVRVLEAFAAPRSTTRVEHVTQAAVALRETLERFPSSAFREYNGSMNRMMMANALDLIALSDGMEGREAMIRRALTGSATGKGSVDSFIAAGLGELVKLSAASVATEVASHDGLCDRIQSALAELKADTLRRHTGRGDVIKSRLAAAGDLRELQDSFAEIDKDLHRLIELMPRRSGGQRSSKAARIARHSHRYPVEVEHCHLGEAARSLSALQEAVEFARGELLRSAQSGT